MSTSFQAWLQQVTQSYYSVSYVANEVDNTLRIFHSLRPQSSIYTLADGRQQSLLNLVGTVAVISQQNSGRIIQVPVEICLPLSYPQELPIIWIRPEMISGGSSVVVRRTDNVDGNGMVWGLEEMKNVRLVDLIGQLQETFAYQLPIVSAPIAIQEEQQEYLGGIIRHTSTGSSSSNSKSIRDRDFSEYNRDRDYNVNSRDQEYGITSRDQEYSVNNRGDNPPCYTTTTNNTNHTNNPSNIALLRDKVMRILEETVKGFEGEIEKVQKQKFAFKEGENVLKRERMTLNNEINLLLKEIDYVESKRNELERFITNNTSNNVNDQRSATIPSDPASSQLLELLANESALMDALYALIKVTVTPANGENRLSLTASLRGIRELSRKHFLTKAHIKKVISK